MSHYVLTDEQIRKLSSHDLKPEDVMTRDNHSLLTWSGADLCDRIDTMILRLQKERDDYKIRKMQELKKKIDLDDLHSFLEHDSDLGQEILDMIEEYVDDHMQL